VTRSRPLSDLVKFVPARTKRSKRFLDIQVEDRHFRIVLNGRIMAHSEDYATPAKARRAAKQLIDAINTRPMRLIFWMGRMGYQKRHVVPVRKLWWLAGRVVALPQDMAVSDVTGTLSVQPEGAPPIFEPDLGDAL